MKLSFWIRLWCSSLMTKTEGEKRALVRLRAQAFERGLDWREVTDDELLVGVRAVAQEFKREGLDAHLLAAGYERVGPEFVLML